MQILALSVLSPEASRKQVLKCGPYLFGQATKSRIHGWHGASSDCGLASCLSSGFRLDPHAWAAGMLESGESFIYGWKEAGSL